jgi:hypothetical protein
MNDATEYTFLTAPGASVDCKVVFSTKGREIQLFGNRAGLLSLANVLFWLKHNSWRREFLSLAELPFVHVDKTTSVCIRITESTSDKSHGVVRKVDNDRSLEWAISDDGLEAAALMTHHLACNPVHEYDRLMVDESSEFGIHLLMVDAREWLR